jgi:hypothetical protein
LEHFGQSFGMVVMHFSFAGEAHRRQMYHMPMKAKAKMSAEYDTFQTALKKVLQVSHSEMQQRIAETKKARASKPRPHVSSDRASGGKD